MPTAPGQRIESDGDEPLSIRAEVKIVRLINASVQRPDQVSAVQVPHLELIVDGTGCDDANACSVGDACAAGVCVGQSPLAPKLTRLRLDDGALSTYRRSVTLSLAFTALAGSNESSLGRRRSVSLPKRCA